jgi:ATP-binding cassette subfamily B protein
MPRRHGASYSARMSSATLAPTSLPALYRAVWDHAEGLRLRLVSALAMLGGSQLLKLAMPWMAAQAINALQTGGGSALGAAGAWIAAIVGLHLGVWTLHGPARVMERSVALEVRRRAADRLYARLVAAPLAGDLQHRVGQASGALGQFTQSQFIYLQNTINLVGPLVALLLLSAPAGLLALAGFLAIGTAIVRFDRALMRLALEENLAERRYVARLIDFVGNISAVASLRLQQATRRLLDARLVQVFAPLRRSIVLTEWKWCAVDLATMLLGWSLVVVYAWTQARTGPLLIGSLFMVWQYAQQAGGVLGSMAANYQALARTQADVASAEPIRAAPLAAAAPAALPAGWQRLVVQGLQFRHAGAVRGGLHGVHLVLERGRRIALVGPSGAGKSTLLRVLAGLYEAERGHVEVDGVAQLGRRHLGDVATLIPQEAEIFEATLRENIALDGSASDAALQAAVQASALDEVLAALPEGLATPMSERGFNLSGGQRQRLALARGVLAAQGSGVLLLDEPTSALDPVTEQRVHQRLAAAFPDACIVASVHRLTLLAHFDTVVLMADGGVLDAGTTDELRARQPLFAAMLAGAAARDDDGSEPIAA